MSQFDGYATAVNGIEGSTLELRKQKAFQES